MLLKHHLPHSKARVFLLSLDKFILSLLIRRTLASITEDLIVSAVPLLLCMTEVRLNSALNYSKKETTLYLIALNFEIVSNAN